MARPLVTIPNKAKTPKSSQIDDMAGDVLAAMNKKLKDMPEAFSFLVNANMIKKWVSSGFDMLDLAISNRPHGGYGYGTVVEFFGLPGTGKSLFAAHALTETQKQGGLAVLYDTEKAVGMLDFYRSVGLDVEKCIYSDKARALEDIFASMDKLIENVIKTDYEHPVTIVIDSVMGATTNVELESGYGIDPFATAKAKILSKAMRKIPSLIAGRNILIIFVNQLKDNIDAVGFGADKYKTTGGTSISFTASLRLEFKHVGALKAGDEEVGNRISVKVRKNRLGPKNRKVVLDMYYDSGGDNYGSWIQFMKDNGMVSQSGSYYTYKDVDGDVRFQAKELRIMLKNDPALRDRIYKTICDRYIMKYKIGDLSIDDVEVIGNELEEDDD